MIFENILNEKFLKARPSWLLNYETGFCLELNGYCKRLKSAFEYDRIQHHEYPNPFHQDKYEFYLQRKRDEMENRKTKIYGVTLIRIRYDVENVKGYIREEWREKNFIWAGEKILLSLTHHKSNENVSSLSQMLSISFKLLLKKRFGKSEYINLI